MSSTDPQWLLWARKLHEIAQNGLHYADNEFDVERYTAVRALASEIMAAHTGRDADVVTNLFVQEIGHATPKMDVRAVVFRAGKVLLVKERSDGKWTLPGGWADVNETPSEGAARETLEESGYHVYPVKLLALYDRSRHGHDPIPYYVYKAFFLCELIDGTPVTSHEIADVGFFGPDELPPLSTSRVRKSQLLRFFEHVRHPDWPTDFD